jgi:hypothetical protein
MQRIQHIGNDEVILPKDSGHKLEMNGKSLDEFYSTSTQLTSYPLTALSYYSQEELTGETTY